MMPTIGYGHVIEIISNLDSDYNDSRISRLGSHGERDIERSRRSI